MTIKSRIVALVSWVDPWLLTALALGAWLRFSQLGDFDNQYYTATVVSMLKSPSNFLFASFDPGGVVAVDKPPLSFWVQAIPVALFGPARWAVPLPQAVAGIMAIVILHIAIKPAFGRVAAAASSLTLAVIPASVVIDSRNEPDSLLSFTLLLAAVSMMLAAKSGKWRWLLVFAVLMGAAFNIKMLVAFVPLPALLLYYGVSSGLPFQRVAIRLSSAVAILLVVAFSWTTVVAFTPPDHRPYVGSTWDNSIWTLVFKYNGLDRFTSFIGPRPNQPGAQPPGGGSQNPPLPQQSSARGYPPRVGNILQNQPQQPTTPADLGLLGLFTQRLAGQTGWLLSLGLVMLMVSLAPLLPERVYRQPTALLEMLRDTPAASQTVLWGGWFATSVLVFGVANSTITHPYYLVGLAVPMASVGGIGFAILWHTYRQGNILGWLLPAALVGGGIYQTVAAHGELANWATALVLVIMPLSALGMAVALWRRVCASILAGVFAVMGALAVLVVPAAVGINAGGPIAGPAAGQARTPAPSSAIPEIEQVRLISSFIERQGDAGSVFAVAAMSAREAAPFIIAGVPAVAIAGFSGNDPIFTRTSFSSMAERGEVRYFLAPGPGAAGRPRGAGGGGLQEDIVGQIRLTWDDVSREARLAPGSLYRLRG